MILLFLFITTVIAFLIFIYSGPQLPAGSDEIIKAVMAEEVVDYSDGEKGYAKNGDISIYYECIGNNKKGSILLITGLNSMLNDWRKYIYQPFVDAGYQVIRFDNRGVGNSDWMGNWDKRKPYILEDMATDGLAILDHLNIPQAHIVGLSMGGMIAQRIAISHSERVLSLTSIMSTGYYHDPELVNVPRRFLINLIRYIIRYGFNRTPENVMKMHLGMRKQLEGNGDYELDVKELMQKSWYEIKSRKGFNPKVRNQHATAIKKSGSRYGELGKINAPTLIVHGKDDTLVKFEHAQKYAPMIPNAKTLFIDGMGHDLPKKYIGEIHTNMLALFSESNAKTGFIKNSK
ncbi:MAG: alpha/beta hydrolase [Saprospiraceae bacterium]